jgi:SSS family solute:Na+ symporter
VGFAMGLFRLGIDTPVKLMDNYSYTEGSFFWIMNNTFFQYYSVLILLVCSAVILGVSYLTNEPAYDKITGLTYATLTDEDRRESRASWTTSDVIFSVLLLAIIIAVYLYFRG